MRVDNIKLDLVSPGRLQGTLSNVKPTISWKVLGNEKSWLQEEYQIRVRFYSDPRWTETDGIQSCQSQFVPWPFRPLTSRESFEVCVRVKGTNSDYTEWSKPVSGQVGFIHELEQWPAQFIALENQPRVDEPTAPETLFRKQFNVSKSVRRARVFSTALGIYNLELNGKKVAEDYLSPGWTTYEMRLLHQFYDVSHLLKQGDFHRRTSWAGLVLWEIWI